MVKATTTDTFMHDIKTAPTTVVDFWAAWCGPCRVMEPVVNKLAQDNPDVQVLKLNVDENPEIAAQYNVSSIPTFIRFDSAGNEVNRFIGASAKLEENLLN